MACPEEPSATLAGGKQQPLHPENRARVARFSRLRTLGAVPTKEQITEKLTQVIDPELRRSIVDLGMVRSIEIREDGRVEVVVSLTTPGCPIR